MVILEICGDFNTHAVVGYANNVSAPGVRRFTTLTFKSMGATSRKLGDFVPKSVTGTGVFRAANFNLTFYDDYGAQRKVKNDTQLTTLYPALETDATLKDAPVTFAYVAGSGWYLGSDWNTKRFNLNDYEIHEGDGFQMYAAINPFAQGVYLTCSGEVVDGITPIVCSPGIRAFTGNVTLGKFKLGQITPVSISGTGVFRAANFNLTFYDDYGAQRKVKNDTQLTTLYPALETDATLKDAPVTFAYVAGSGWYLGSDWNTKRFNLNDYEISPADGFQVYAAINPFAQGVILNLPSALPPKSAD